MVPLCPLKPSVSSFYIELHAASAFSFLQGASLPEALVDRAAKTFRKTDGDLREVMRTILTSREFLSASDYRAKVKSPFEYVASALRANCSSAAKSTTLTAILNQSAKSVSLTSRRL